MIREEGRGKACTEELPLGMGSRIRSVQISTLQHTEEGKVIEEDGLV